MQVFVVEGKNDIKVVKSVFPKSVCIKTNGLGINKTTLDQLKSLEKDNEIIIITDPDSAGTKIRNIVLSEIPSASFLDLPKDKCIKKHKAGLENLSKEEFSKILNTGKLLNKAILQQNNFSKSFNFSLFDLFELKLTGPESRGNKNKLHFLLGIYHFNTKQLLNFLNNSNYSKQQLKEVLNA